MYSCRKRKEIQCCKVEGERASNGRVREGSLEVVAFSDGLPFFSKLSFTNTQTSIVVFSLLAEGADISRQMLLSRGTQTQGT